MNEQNTALQKEAQSRWGHTPAWAEYMDKSRFNDMRKAGQDTMTLLSEMGALRHLNPADEVIQQKVAAFQQHITDRLYTCTDEILQDLGNMYVQDDRFRKNIDKQCGEGAAEFIHRAFDVYCAKAK